MISHLTVSVERHDAGNMSGMLNTTVSIAGLSGVAVFGSIYLSMSRGFPAAILVMGLTDSKSNRQPSA